MKPFFYLRRPPEIVESEVDEELSLHLEMRVEELTARGMSIDAARREALRQFGDLAATREYCRRQAQEKETRMRRGLMLEDLVQDLRISLRSLLRVPMMTLTIMVTVGLGIGATTVILGAVHAAFLRPLPYVDPDRLVRIFTDVPPIKFRFSVADYHSAQSERSQMSKFTPIGRKDALSVGRLPVEHLPSPLRSLAPSDPRLIIGREIAEGAAVMMQAIAAWSFRPIPSRSRPRASDVRRRSDDR